MWAKKDPIWSNWWCTILWNCGNFQRNDVGGKLPPPHPQVDKVIDRTLSRIKNIKHLWKEVENKDFWASLLNIRQALLQNVIYDLWLQIFFFLKGSLPLINFLLKIHRRFIRCFCHVEDYWQFSVIFSAFIAFYDHNFLFYGKLPSSSGKCALYPFLFSEYLTS